MLSEITKREFNTTKHHREWPPSRLVLSRLRFHNLFIGVPCARKFIVLGKILKADHSINTILEKCYSCFGYQTKTGV